MPRALVEGIMLIFSLVETETTEGLGNSSKATENILTSIMLCCNQFFGKIKFVT